MRKISVDNSVRYIPNSEQTKERHVRANTRKNRKQNRNISQKNKKFVKDFAAEGFRVLEWIMNCYS